MSAVWFTSTLCLGVWVFQSLHWNSILDGDSALYSLMSLEVLEGRHYLYTAGQAHGGTLLVYLRAFLFKLFGPSQFLGFFINGVVVAAAAGLWARFALTLSGRTAALVTGVLAALGSSIFAQYSCTDYYALALLSGGLMLNLALHYARRESVPTWHFGALGLLLGVSLYACRFTPLYAILAAAFFLARCAPTRRALWLPSWTEVWRGGKRKRWLSRLLAVAMAVNACLAAAAFFTDDRFLGVNAEISLKLAVKLGGVLWLVHRWPVVFGWGSASKLACFAAGALAGWVPDIVFRKIHPEVIDRTTGLVRWSDLAPLLAEFPRRLGGNFSRPHPETLGMAAAAAAAAIVVIGLWRSDATRPSSRKWLAVAIAASIPAVASWLLIHTYMHFVVQYFYPSYFPLYLCVGLAVAATRHRRLAAALLVPVVAVAVSDLADNWSRPNHRLESGVFETLREWRVTRGTGDFWSTYDMMWASKGEFMLDPLYASRFPRFQREVTGESRIGYVYRGGDAVPEGKRAYRVVRRRELRHGYVVELLEKAGPRSTRR